MSWQQDLINMYDRNADKAGRHEKITRYGKESEIMLVPLSHAEFPAHITVDIDREGNFIGAKAAEKGSGAEQGNEWMTLMPVTEKSESRANAKPMPTHAYCEELQYLAGDFGDYGEIPPGDAHGQYMGNLEKWGNSAYGHEKVSALYQYLSKNSLMHDLEKAGIADCKGKVNGTKLAKCRARFRIIGTEPEECWLDQALVDSWINYYRTVVESTIPKDICYLTGQYVPVTYRHPRDIRYKGDMTFLFSSNRSTDFTFKGQFKTKEEAFAIGYTESQKLHRALRWLIQKFGVNIDSLCILVYPDGTEDLPRWYVDTEMFTYQSEGYTPVGNVHVLMLASTSSDAKGRLSVVEERTLPAEEYFANLKRWHVSGWSQCRVNDDGKKHYFTGMPSANRLAEILYGREIERNGKWVLALDTYGKAKKESDAKTKRRAISQLFPCIVYGEPARHSLLSQAADITTRPYKSQYNKRVVLQAACALEKEETMAGLDKNRTDRSYLYGRLLAIAHWAEMKTFGDEENRETTASRYMQAFSQDPCRVWDSIRKRLEPYLRRSKPQERIFYEREMDGIYTLFEPGDFEKRARLDGVWHLGYGHQLAEFSTYRKVDLTT